MVSADGSTRPWTKMEQLNRRTRNHKKDCDVINAPDCGNFNTIRQPDVAETDTGSSGFMRRRKRQNCNDVNDPWCGNFHFLGSSNNMNLALEKQTDIDTDTTSVTSDSDGRSGTPSYQTLSRRRRYCDETVNSPWCGNFNPTARENVNEKSNNTESNSDSSNDQALSRKRRGNCDEFVNSPWCGNFDHSITTDVTESIDRKDDNEENTPSDDTEELLSRRRRGNDRRLYCAVNPHSPYCGIMNVDPDRLSRNRNRHVSRRKRNDGRSYQPYGGNFSPSFRQREPTRQRLEVRPVAVQKARTLRRSKRWQNSGGPQISHQPFGGNFSPSFVLAAETTREEAPPPVVREKLQPHTLRRRKRGNLHHTPYGGNFNPTMDVTVERVEPQAPVVGPLERAEAIVIERTPATFVQDRVREVASARLERRKRYDPNSGNFNPVFHRRPTQNHRNTNRRRGGQNRRGRHLRRGRRNSAPDAESIIEVAGARLERRKRNNPYDGNFSPIAQIPLNSPDTNTNTRTDSRKSGGQYLRRRSRSSASDAESVNEMAAPRLMSRRRRMNVNNEEIEEEELQRRIRNQIEAPLSVRNRRRNLGAILGTRRRNSTLCDRNVNSPFCGNFHGFGVEKPRQGRQQQGSLNRQRKTDATDAELQGVELQRRLRNQQEVGSPDAEASLGAESPLTEPPVAGVPAQNQGRVALGGTLAWQERDSQRNGQSVDDSGYIHTVGGKHVASTGRQPTTSREIRVNSGYTSGTLVYGNRETTEGEAESSVDTDGRVPSVESETDSGVYVHTYNGRHVASNGKKERRIRNNRPHMSSPDPTVGSIPVENPDLEITETESVTETDETSGYVHTVNGRHRAKNVKPRKTDLVQNPDLSSVGTSDLDPVNTRNQYQLSGQSGSSVENADTDLVSGNDHLPYNANQYANLQDPEPHVPNPDSFAPDPYRSSRASIRKPDPEPHGTYVHTRNGNHLALGLNRPELRVPDYSIYGPRNLPLSRRNLQSGNYGVQERRFGRRYTNGYNYYNPYANSQYGNPRRRFSNPYRQYYGVEYHRNPDSNVDRRLVANIGHSQLRASLTHVDDPNSRSQRQRRLNEADTRSHPNRFDGQRGARNYGSRNPDEPVYESSPQAGYPVVDEDWRRTGLSDVERSQGNGRSSSNYGYESANPCERLVARQPGAGEVGRTTGCYRNGVEVPCQDCAFEARGDTNPRVGRDIDPIVVGDGGRPCANGNPGCNRRCGGCNQPVYFSNRGCQTRNGPGSWNQVDGQWRQPIGPLMPSGLCDQIRRCCQGQGQGQGPGQWRGQYPRQGFQGPELLTNTDRGPYDGNFNPVAINPLPLSVTTDPATTESTDPGGSVTEGVTSSKRNPVIGPSSSPERKAQSRLDKALTDDRVPEVGIRDEAANQEAGDGMTSDQQSADLKVEEEPEGAETKTKFRAIQRCPEGQTLIKDGRQWRCQQARRKAVQNGGQPIQYGGQRSQYGGQGNQYGGRAYESSRPVRHYRSRQAAGSRRYRRLQQESIKRIRQSSRLLEEIRANKENDGENKRGEEITTCVPKCQNGGLCYYGQCLCPKAFTGKHCQTAARTCPLQCRNGGRCENRRCVCTRGFYGRLCQKDKNECLRSSPCSHQCLNTVGSYKCLCPSGSRLDSDLKNCVIGNS